MRCRWRTSSIVMTTLERAGAMMLRLMASGRVGSTTSLPSVTVQVAPAAATLISCGRSSLMRTIATSCPRRADALLMALPCSALSAATAIVASVSNTSHTVSARRNTAAGVGAANGNDHADTVAVALDCGRDHRVGRFRRAGILAPSIRARARRLATASPAVRPGADRPARPAALPRAARAVRRGGAGDSCPAVSPAVMRCRAPCDRLRLRTAAAAVHSAGGGAGGGSARSRRRLSGRHRLRRDDRGRSILLSGKLGGQRRQLVRPYRPVLAHGGLAFGRLDIDNKAVVLAEGAHVDARAERKAHQHGVVVGFAVDRFDGRRQRRLGVRQIEPQHGVEDQRQLVPRIVRRYADELRQIEDIAREGRLGDDLHPDRRHLALLRQHALLAHAALRIAGAARELLDDVARQAGRQSAPVLRQEVDEHPLAGVHLIHRHLAGERDTDAFAVGIAARDAHISRHAGTDAIDGDIDRTRKGNGENIIGDPNLGFHLLGELEDEACVAVLDRGGDFRLSPLARRRGAQPTGDSANASKQKRSAANRRACHTHTLHTHKYLHANTTRSHAATRPRHTRPRRLTRP